MVIYTIYNLIMVDIINKVLKRKCKTDVEAKKAIVLMRHGSLHTNERRLLSCEQISMAVGVRLGSVKLILHRWKKNGFIITDDRRKNNKGPARKAITQA